MSADTMERLRNGNSRRDQSRAAILARLRNDSVPFNKLSPWYQKQLTSEAITQARQKCVCAFNPRPDEQEAELFCAECVAVVNIVNPKALSKRFAVIFARALDGKLVEPMTGAEFGE